jgi:hypothetical protein
MLDELIVGETSVVNELLQRGACFLHGDEIDHGQIARPDFQREPLADCGSPEFKTCTTNDW